MESFGVCFRIDRPDVYSSLVELFEALKQSKEDDHFDDAEKWEGRLADSARSNFDWPSEKERKEWSAIRASHPIVITPPEGALGHRWGFDDVLDCVESGEYSLLEIAQTAEGTAELRIDPHAYPYGGIGAFIALVEAHGMHILGVNEYGKYLPRSELIGSNQRVPKKPWWKFW